MRGAGFKAVPERGQRFNGQGLSAGMGINGGTGECGGDAGWGELRSAEIIGEGLSLLRKDLADEGEKSGFVEVKFHEARRESPAEYGGMNVGRRGKRFGWEGEQLLGWAVELDCH